MALYERAKKILVGTNHFNTFTIRLSHRIWRRQCNCTVYLYNILIRTETNMRKDKSKSTILVITIGFLAIHLVFSCYWAAIVSLIVGIIGIVSSYLSAKIDWAWMKLSKLLSYIIPNIILSIVFFLFLFPISLLSKLFNKDLLMLSNKYDSYFIDVNKELDKKSFEKMW